MITAFVRGRVNDVYTKDWEVDNKKGTSYIVNIYQGDGNSEEINVTQQTFPFYHDMIGKEVELECKFFSKGKYNLKVVEDVQ